MCARTLVCGERLTCQGICASTFVCSERLTCQGICARTHVCGERLTCLTLGISRTCLIMTCESCASTQLIAARGNWLLLILSTLVLMNCLSILPRDQVSLDAFDLHVVMKAWVKLLKVFHYWRSCTFSSLKFPVLKVVGSSCPLLKSFTLNRKAYRHQGINDAEAYAVAKTMHGLRHLRLSGNEMTNDGLRAILDNCPHLESLDIRQCFNVDLRGELKKRCFEQLKNLRHPHDSTEDYEFDVETSEDDSFDDYVSGLSESSGDGFDSEYVDYLLSIGAMEGSDSEGNKSDTVLIGFSAKFLYIFSIKILFLVTV